MASAEILRFRPISGIFQEIPFDAHGNTTWVKFTDDSYEDWCGIFGGGCSLFSAVACSSEAPTAFVVSVGQGYFVNVNSRAMLYKTESDQITAAAYIPRSNRVVACDWTNIYILGVDGSVWKSGRVSFDGIGFKEITENQITGWVNDLSDDGVEFRLRLEPFSYDCSWRYPH